MWLTGFIDSLRNEIHQPDFADSAIAARIRFD